MGAPGEPQILAETDSWVVVNKPPFWLSVPPSTQDAAPPRTKGEVLHWLREKGIAARAVHRLDVETSGVLLYAKSEGAHRTACQWFERRLIKKIYCCLCESDASRSPLPIFRISTPIRSQKAVTQVQVLESWASGFLARVQIITGRRHQIRIHLAQAGFPLYGDLQYGGQAHAPREGDVPLKVDRVALHAETLELPDGERFRAPWCADFSEWANQLGLKAEHEGL